MRSTQFHHFVVAGVIAMSAAGLVTINSATIGQAGDAGTPGGAPAMGAMRDGADAGFRGPGMQRGMMNGQGGSGPRMDGGRPMMQFHGAPGGMPGTGSQGGAGSADASLGGQDGAARSAPFDMQDKLRNAMFPMMQFHGAPDTRNDNGMQKPPVQEAGQDGGMFKKPFMGQGAQGGSPTGNTDGKWNAQSASAASQAGGTGNRKSVAGQGGVSEQEMKCMKAQQQLTMLEKLQDMITQKIDDTQAQLDKATGDSQKKIYGDRIVRYKDSLSKLETQVMNLQAVSDKYCFSDQSSDGSL